MYKGNADDADYYDWLRFLIDKIIYEIKWGEMRKGNA